MTSRLGTGISLTFFFSAVKIYNGKISGLESKREYRRIIDDDISSVPLVVYVIPILQFTKH